MRLPRTMSVLAFGLLLFAARPSVAADRDAVRSGLLAAREKFAEMQTLRVVYYAKKELVNQVEADLNVRREVEANARWLKILIDSYPSRRNSLQEVDYQNWLAARATLTGLDREIDQLRSQMREIDEMLLLQAEANGRRPGPGNRRDILVVFPEVEKQCGRAFDSLRSAVSEASRDAGNADRVLQEANADLNRSGEGDAKFGPSREFFDAFRRYKSPAKAAPTKPRPKAAPKR